MRILTAIIFTVSTIGSSLTYGNQQCSTLFGAESGPVIIAGLLPAPKPKNVVEITQVKSESNRVELKKHTGSEEPEKITLEEMKFSERPDEAMRELLNMVIKNSSYILDDKNVLTKGELSLGIPAADGKYFEVKYKSVSSDRSQFVVDKITLRTPTGSGDKKIAESFLKSGEFKIKKSEHEIGDALGAGVNVKLKIPLVIDGPLLQKFDTYSKCFEYFKKDELRALFASKSILKIRTVLEFRRARVLFLKVLIKEPMKAAIGYGFVALTAAALSINMAGKSLPDMSHHDTNKNIAAELVLSRSELSGILENRINNHDIPKANVRLNAQMSELKKEISDYLTKNAQVPYSGPSLKDLNLNTTTLSPNHQTWIFEKQDAYNNSVHTYIVFAQEKASSVGPGLQYVIMEINANKYSDLVTFIKQQQSVPTIQEKVR